MSYKALRAIHHRFFVCFFLPVRFHKRDPEIERAGDENLKNNTVALGVYLDQALNFSHHIEQVKAKSWRAYHSARQVVGNDWRASLGAVKNCMRDSFVQG